MSIDHMICVDGPGMEMPGLLTGQMTITADGKLEVEFVSRAPNEGEAFAHALRLQSEAQAVNVMALLQPWLDPGVKLHRVEIRRAAA